MTKQSSESNRLQRYELLCLEREARIQQYDRRQFVKSELAARRDFRSPQKKIFFPLGALKRKIRPYLQAAALTNKFFL
jgi:hypothetical protein